MTVISDAIKKSIRGRLENAFDLTDTEKGGDLDKYLELLFFDHADTEKAAMLVKIMSVLSDHLDDANDRMSKGAKARDARMEWMAEGEAQALHTIIDQLERLNGAIERRLSNQWLAADKIASEREAKDRAASRKYLK